ncbi:hypothetical protein D3C79_933580 [compost metagenome]
MQLRQIQALLGIGRLRRADKERAEQRAAGAADARQQRHARIFKNKTDVFIRHRRQFFHHLVEAAVHVQTMVGVADFGIQPGQKITFPGKHLAAAHQPVHYLLFR